MSRKFARILTSIWQDERFRVVSHEGQWAYFMLLSQPELSIVGGLDYSPRRWVHAWNITLSDVEDAIEELEIQEFVFTDHDTDELLIRSFLRHGLHQVAVNVNILKGIWNQWEQMRSPWLRQMVIDNAPDWVINSPRVSPPDSALPFMADRQTPWSWRSPPSSELASELASEKIEELKIEENPPLPPQAETGGEAEAAGEQEKFPSIGSETTAARGTFLESVLTEFANRKVNDARSSGETIRSETAFRDHIKAQVDLPRLVRWISEYHGTATQFVGALLSGSPRYLNRKDSAVEPLS